MTGWLLATGAGFGLAVSGWHWGMTLLEEDRGRPGRSLWLPVACTFAGAVLLFTSLVHLARAVQ